MDTLINEQQINMLDKNKIEQLVENNYEEEGSNVDSFLVTEISQTELDNYNLETPNYQTRYNYCTGNFFAKVKGLMKKVTNVFENTFCLLVLRRNRPNRRRDVIKTVRVEK